MGGDGRRPARVAVTVLAYRSAATVVDAVRSALEQDHCGRVDVLVREQGGDRDELALLDAIRPPGRDRSIHVESGPNLGFAGGHERLLATEVARAADVVVLLNADARLDRSFLRHALAALDADPAVGAVQGKLLRPGGCRVVDGAGLQLRRTRRAEARFQGEPDDGRAEEPGEVFGVDGAVAVYRRAALDDVAVDGHVLATGFRSYHEDVELAWRLRWRGWSTRYEPRALAWHGRSVREDAGMRRRERLRRRRGGAAEVRRQAFANARLLPLRVEPFGRLARDAGPYLARELGGWASLLWSSPGDVAPCAWRVLRGLPATLRARRAILARRRPGADPYRWIGRPFVASDR